MKRMRYATIAILAVLAPRLAEAVTAPTTFSELVNLILGLIQTLILFLFALTFLVVAWNLIKRWILGAGDEESIKKGNKTVLVGVIVLVVASSVWGILALLREGLFGV